MVERGDPALGGRDLHPARLLGLFRTNRIGGTVVLIDRCESTNKMASGARGAAEGTVLIAEEQYAGRGRSGRRWFSVPGKSLVVSIVLMPRRGASGLTQLLAVSAARALDGICGGIGVKWPNDLYLAGRKLGGILAEGKNGFAVLGFGINVNEEKRDFADEIVDAATSLLMHTGRYIDRGAVLADILARFEEGYIEWEQSGFARFRQELEKRLLYRGEEVSVQLGAEMIEGRILGISDEGYLRIGVNGGERVVAAGDVSVRR